MRRPLRPPRTALSLRSIGGQAVEVISAGQNAWRFRMHYHAGDEVVRLLAGRARLRLSNNCREVSAGETVIVPAGVVHRFEPVDDAGWAFTSEFVLRRDTPGAFPSTRSDERLVAQAIDLLALRRGLRSDVDGLAVTCRVSAGHLARTFHRVTGTGLHNFHVVQVLQKAKGFIRAGVPLAEAALDAGFYDQAHLTRECVRTYGFTPKDYRSAWLAAA
jgi:AraC-like DNA-binding protein